MGTVEPLLLNKEMDVSYGDILQYSDHEKKLLSITMAMEVMEELPSLKKEEDVIIY